jgi:hypothetical protein
VGGNTIGAPTLSVDTVTDKAGRDEDSDVTQSDKEFSMADIDRSAQFDRISDEAKTASDKLKAANQSTRDRLESDLDCARDRAAAAADRINDKADAAGDKASSEWHEIRAKVKANAKKGQDHLDARLAETDAEMAED